MDSKAFRKRHIRGASQFCRCSAFALAMHSICVSLAGKMPALQTSINLQMWDASHIRVAWTGSVKAKPVWRSRKPCGRLSVPIRERQHTMSPKRRRPDQRICYFPASSLRTYSNFQLPKPQCTRCMPCSARHTTNKPSTLKREVL
jgi:hypothetical protein